MSTERLARWCSRRPWVTLGAWLLALVLAVATIVALLDLTSEGELTSNPESERGYEPIGGHFPPDPDAEFVNELILVRSAPLTVDDPAFREKVGELLGEIRAAASPTTPPATTRAVTQASCRRIGARRCFPVGLIEDCEAGAERLIAIVAAADGGEFDAPLRRMQQRRGSEPDP